MAYNTGNPIGSSDLKDLSDNAEDLDQALLSQGPTWTDRRGNTHPTLRSAEAAAQNVQDSAAAHLTAMQQDADSVDSAASNAINTEIPAEVQRAADYVETVLEPDTADALDMSVAKSAMRAEFQADRAETARDAAFINAEVYDSVTGGLAGVADGEQFQVVQGDQIDRYRRVDQANAVKVASYISAEKIQNVSADSIFGIMVNDDKTATLMSNAGELYIPGLDSGVASSIADLHKSSRSALDMDKIIADVSRDEDVIYTTIFDWTGEQDGNRAFAPAVVRTGRNTAFAVAERRGVNGTSSSDTGEKMIFGRTIKFNRKSRQLELGQIINIAGQVTENTIGPYNPSLIYVEKGNNAGRIYLFYSILSYDELSDEYTGFAPKIRHSDDGGSTWSAEIDAPSFSSRYANNGYLVGPGSGMQLNSGRLIVGAYFTSNPTTAFLIYSDDGGDTWSKGPENSLDGVNESVLVDNKDGDLLWIMRRLNIGKAYSILESDTLKIKETGYYNDYNNQNVFDDTIAIQTGATQHASNFDAAQEKVLVTMPSEDGKREKMTLFVSYDKGRSYPYKLELNPGRAAEYSDITSFGANDILCVFTDGSPPGSDIVVAGLVSLNAFLE